MWNGKLKALTFSYDDGVLQDKRLIRILDRYGLKCTFNLNSARFGRTESIHSGRTVEHSTLAEPDVRAVYAGHEIAAHTCTHPMLPSLDEPGIVSEVRKDMEKLSALAGYPVCGMAYPGGGVNHDERVIGVIKKNVPEIRYARTITSTYSFDIPPRLLELDPTVFHMEWDRMVELCHRFVDLEPDRPQMLYIWGHAYEFDAAEHDAYWTRFEDLCRFLGGRNDIFYGTNREVLLDLPQNHK